MSFAIQRQESQRTMNNLETLASTFTLEELAVRSGRSVEAIIAYAMNGKEKPKKTNGAPDVGFVAKEIDTRSPEGRQQYDAQVYDTLSVAKIWLSAAALRQEVGGTPLQMRTALNRLVELDKVIYQGQARATQYKVQ